MKLSIMAIALALLTACAGGGGASNPSTPPITSWDTSPNQAYATGDTVKTANDVTAVIGPRDPNGALWSQIFARENTLTGFAANANLNGKVLGPAHPEVLAAHADGWTGKGKNVLVYDGFKTTGSEIAHGNIVNTLILRYAPGVQLTGSEFFDEATENTYTTVQLQPIARANGFVITDQTIRNSGTNIHFDVINLSLGSARLNRPSSDWTSFVSQLASTNSASSPTSSGVMVNNTFAHADATITKAAGNDGAPAQGDALNIALMENASTRGRTLLVGATNASSSAALPKVNFENYSNTCGNYCARFLTAGGSDPFGNYSADGTSFAAPRVAGYAAIVRQKFSNINGAQTADLLLQTARRDTINNYDPSVHGMGEASLSRALAPAARLR